DRDLAVQQTHTSLLFPDEAVSVRIARGGGPKRGSSSIRAEGASAPAEPTSSKRRRVEAPSQAVLRLGKAGTKAHPRSSGLWMSHSRHRSRTIPTGRRPLPITRAPRRARAGLGGSPPSSVPS